MGGYAGWWSSGRTEEQGHLDMNVRALDGNDKDALGSPRIQALSRASGSDGGAFAFEGIHFRGCPDCVGRGSLAMHQAPWARGVARLLNMRLIVGTGPMLNVNRLSTSIDI